MRSPAESRQGSLARNTVMNIAGQVIPLLAAVAAIPYVVRGLGAERFGILSLAWLVLGYFALLDFGLGRAATKFIAECLAQREFERLPGLLWTSVGLQIVMGACGGVLLAVLVPVLVARVFRVPPGLQSEARAVFFLLCCSLPLVLATNGLRAALEAAQRFDLVNLLRVPASISVYLLPALGVGLHATLPQIILAMVFARVLVTAAHLACCRYVLPGFGLRPRWSGGAVKVLLRYGGWVTISNLANPVLLYIDRFFIGSVLSLALLGSYSVPFEAVTKLWIIPASLASSLFPAFSALIAPEHRSRVELLYSRSFKYLLLLLGPVVLLLLIFAREILTLWMGTAFAGQTAAVFQILACGVFVNCFAHVPFGLLQSHGRPDLAAIILLCELPLYLPMAWMLVRHGGITGAALGWTLRVTVEAAILAVMVSRVFSLHPCLAGHGMRRSLCGICFLGFFLVGVKLIFEGSVAIQLTLSVALTVVFCGLVWRMILDGADRGQVRHMFSPLLAAAKSSIAS